MKKTCLILISIIASIQLFGQWTQLNSGSSAWLRGVWFISNNEGIVVGYGGTILRTEDSGDSWEIIESNTDNHLFSIFFANQQVGYITGANGIILKTTNGGLNWVKIKEGGGTIHESYFVTPQLGYVAGEEGQVLKTTDGGQNWITLQLGSFNGKVSVFFNNSNVGYFVGIGSNDAVMKTTNGGSSFTGQYTGSAAEFSSVFFTDDNNGFACSTTDPTKIIRTSNGGQTWIESLLPFGQGLYAIKFFDTMNGYTVGGFPDASIILRTNDGGNTWNQDNSPTDEPLFDVFTLSKNYAFAVGKNGTIIRLGEAVSTNKLGSAFPVQIFPNPSSDFLIIKRDTATTGEMFYQLSDTKGMNLQSGKVSVNEIIEIMGMGSNMYFITLYNDDIRKTYKIVKE